MAFHCRVFCFFYVNYLFFNCRNFPWTIISNFCKIFCFSCCCFLLRFCCCLPIYLSLVVGSCSWGEFCFCCRSLCTLICFRIWFLFRERPCGTMGMYISSHWNCRSKLRTSMPSCCCKSCMKSCCECILVVSWGKVIILAWIVADFLNLSDWKLHSVAVAFFIFPKPSSCS